MEVCGCAEAAIHQTP